MAQSWEGKGALGGAYTGGQNVVAQVITGVKGQGVRMSLQPGAMQARWQAVQAGGR